VKKLVVIKAFIVAQVFVVAEAFVVARSAFYDEAIQASTFIKYCFLYKSRSLDCFVVKSTPRNDERFSNDEHLRNNEGFYNDELFLQQQTFHNYLVS